MAGFSHPGFITDDKTIKQTGVALKRIAVYLDEEEVTDQVSSLKHVNSTEPYLPGGEDEEGLGLENATLKWNEVVDVEKQEKQDKKKNGVLGLSASSPTSSNDDVESVATSDVETAASDSGSLLAGLETDHKFELRDITVRFPEGQLSVVTGPTASGKTALLVSCRISSLSSPVLIARRWRCLER